MGKNIILPMETFFDSITMTKKWLAILGDYGYDLLLHLNAILNFIRKKVGIKNIGLYQNM